MAEWPCFEPVSPGSSGAKSGFRRPIEAYSQGLGSMITEPPTDGQRTPCRNLKPCILAVRSLPSFAGPLSAMSWQSQDLARIKTWQESRLGRIRTWQNQDLAKSR